MPHVTQSPVINQNQIVGVLMEKIETWLSYLLLVALTMSDIFLKYSRLDPTTISSPVIV